MTTLTLIDEATSGAETVAGTLAVPELRLTAREIIHRRARLEAQVRGAAEDGFATRARTDLADVLADPTAAPLLLHCSTLTSVRPSGTWQRRCREIGAGYPQAVDTLQRTLRLVGETRVMPMDFHHGYVFMKPESTAFVRGAVWAYALLAGADGAELVGDVAVHCGRKGIRRQISGPSGR